MSFDHKGSIDTVQRRSHEERISNSGLYHRDHHFEEVEESRWKLQEFGEIVQRVRDHLV